MNAPDAHWDLISHNFSDTAEQSVLQHCGLSGQHLRYIPRCAIRMAFVATFSDGSFQHDPGGRPMVQIITNLLADGSIEDVLAFDPVRPGTWFLLTGIASMLGEYELSRRWYERPHLQPPHASPQGFTSEPLAVFADPLEWLRNKCAGCVVLDERAYRDLGQIEAGLIASSQRHAADLVERIRFPAPVPDIYVREGTA